MKKHIYLNNRWGLGRVAFLGWSSRCTGVAVVTEAAVDMAASAEGHAGFSGGARAGRSGRGYSGAGISPWCWRLWREALLIRNLNGTLRQLPRLRAKP